MTTFIMGHGEYHPKDTFVPDGTKIGVYAKDDETLAITIGMAVLAHEGGYKPRKEFPERGPIHNYRVDPLTAPELAMMRAVASPANTIIYVGHGEQFPQPTILCDGDDQLCKDGVHRCTGILGQIKDPDIRLAFCLRPASRAGLAKMTTEFPEGAEYSEITRQLAGYQQEALTWLAAVKKTPGTKVAAFRAFQDNPQTSAQAAFVLASSARLQEFLVLHKARARRLSVSAVAFLQDMHDLPEETRYLVWDTLREEDTQPLPAVGHTAPERFIELFFLRTTDQRYDAWMKLSSTDQATVAEVPLIGAWDRLIRPFVARYRAALGSNRPAFMCYTTVVAKAASEIEQQEAEAAAAYRILFEGCMTFPHTATVQAKNQLWNDLAGNDKAWDLLKMMNHNGSGPWAPDLKADEDARAKADQWTTWLKTYQNVG